MPDRETQQALNLIGQQMAELRARIDALEKAATARAALNAPRMESASRSSAEKPKSS